MQGAGNMNMAAEEDTLLPHRARPGGAAPKPGTIVVWSVAVAFLAGAALAGSLVLRAVHPSSTPSTASLAAVMTKGGGGKHGMDAMCASPRFTKTTLKTAFEETFFGLFRDQKGEKKFEASDVIDMNNDYYYAICDNSWAIHKIRADLPSYSRDNVLIGDPNRETEDSGYEAIFHVDGIFHVVRESVQHDSGRYHAIVEELAVDDAARDYQIVTQCRTEFEFEGDSKGFEGAVAFRGVDGLLYMLGLCEGNHCAEGKKGKEKGNGRVVVTHKETEEDGSCLWKTDAVLSVPPSANFQDYSAIAVDATGRVAITSQEESQVWIGRFKLTEAGAFDFGLAGFDGSVGDVYDFPRNDACDVVYCNVEGIHWLTDELLLAVSDKMKSKGRQEPRCLIKDQSAHVFSIP